MKKSEVIGSHYTELREKLVSLYDTVIRAEGHLDIKLYIWDDGSMDTLTVPHGSNNHLSQCLDDGRDMYYVYTVQGFDPWQEEPRPDDDDEAEEMLDDMIEYMTSDYWDVTADILDQVIREAEYEEV